MGPPLQTVVQDLLGLGVLCAQRAHLYQICQSGRRWSVPQLALHDLHCALYVRIVEIVRGIRRLVVVALLDDEEIVIGPQRTDLPRERRHGPHGVGDADLRMIQVVQNRPGKSHRGTAIDGRPAIARPEGCLDVFDDVDARVGHSGKQRLKAGDDMVGNMASVVDDDIERAMLLRNFGEKCFVVLRAPQQCDPRVEHQLLCVDIDADYAPARKVLRPHRQRRPPRLRNSNPPTPISRRRIGRSRRWANSA